MKRCVVLLCLVGTPACGTSSKTEAVEATGERFHARGKITALSANEVDIHHEQIAAVRGFDGTVKPMVSMTMPFARARTSFTGLAVGDAVEIDFTVHYDREPTLRLARIAKLPPDTKLELP